MIAQLLDRDVQRPRMLGRHLVQYELAVGQGAGRTGDHALAAGDARGIAHRVVEVEGDAGTVALAHAAKYLVVANLATATDATVAQDAGVVIDRNDDRRLVVTAIASGAREARRVRIEFELPGDG